MERAWRYVVGLAGWKTCFEQEVRGEGCENERESWNYDVSWLGSITAVAVGEPMTRPIGSV